jgi:hypothetical protein
MPIIRDAQKRQRIFLWDLHPILVEAGWENIDWLEGLFVIRQGPDRPVSGPVGATNVEIHMHPSFRNLLLPAALH